jgi:excisionase family DNA binding protein
VNPTICLSPALNTKQAAEYLSVTPETVRRLCRKRKIPCAKVGSDYRIRLQDLDALFLRPEKPVTLTREESLRLLK